MGPPLAFAESHTVSLGYAQLKADDVKLKGVNAQYRYEWDSPLSALVSSSYLTGNDRSDYRTGYENVDAKYFSLLAGPAYRINEYVSAYAIGGLAQTRTDYEEKSYNGSYYSSEKNNKTSFAYGVGAIFNATPNVSINIGYEGTKVSGNKVNGFNIGAGYRF